jgi:hypothetical protein
VLQGKFVLDTLPGVHVLEDDTQAYKIEIPAQDVVDLLLLAAVGNFVVSPVDP